MHEGDVCDGVIEVQNLLIQISADAVNIDYFLINNKDKFVVVVLL